MSEGKEKRVLVIDDDELVRSVLRKMIEYSGAAVVTAANAEEAKKILTTSDPFNLILLDLIMPNENGWMLLDWIEEIVLAESSDTAIVAISGAELSAEEKKKLSKRTSAIVQKRDFSLDKMKALLSKLLS